MLYHIIDTRKKECRTYEIRNKNEKVKQFMILGTRSAEKEEHYNFIKKQQYCNKSWVNIFNKEQMRKNHIDNEQKMNKR